MIKMSKPPDTWQHVVVVREGVNWGQKELDIDDIKSTGVLINP